MEIKLNPPWKFLSYVLVLALGLILAGCSGSQPSAAPTQSSAPTQPSGMPDTGTEEAVITFAAGEFQRKFFEPLMETFHEQNPGITVQFVDLNQSFNDPEEEWTQYTYYKKLAQAADTVVVQGPFTMDMSRYFRNLQPIYESDLSFQADDFWPGVLNSCQDTYGNTIGLPLTASITGIFYDEAAFDKAGLPYPQPGWTWDDFQKAATALTEKSGNQIRYGFYDQPELGGSILAPVVADQLGANGGQANPAELYDDIKWYVDLAQAGVLSGIKEGDELANAWDERTKLFENDALRPAMWVDSLISPVPTTEPFDPSNPYYGMAIERFGFAPFPVSADGSSDGTSRSWVECAVVSSGSTNPRAAWAWLNFLSSHWTVMDKSQVYEISRAPSRLSVADAEGYWDLLPAKIVPSVRYALEHGSYDFNYIERFGDINIALASTIAKNTDFVQALETVYAALPEQTPTPTADPAPIVVATPVAPLPEGVTALKYYISAYSQEEYTALKTLIEQFNQSATDVHISLLTEFQGEPNDDWTTAMAKNSDCFTTNVPNWPSFDTSSVLNLNSLLSNEPVEFSNDFYPQLMEKFRQEGNQYALPVSSQMQMIAYNADLLARRGLPIPANDWTFNDFIETIMAVASTSDTDPSYGFPFTPYNEFFSAGKGIEWIDASSTPPQVYLDKPETQEFLQWLAKLEKEQVIFDQDAAWEKLNKIMISGQLGFWVAAMGEQEAMFGELGRSPDYKIGMAPFPQVSGENPMTSWSNDRGHFISAQSQNPRACWDFFKFLSEQPTLFSGVPARRSFAESPAWETRVGKDNAAAYRAALENYKPPVVVEVDPMVQQILWPLNELKVRTVKAAFEGQDLQPVLVAQQQKSEDFLDCALALDTSKPIEQLGVSILDCIKQADPEGNW